MVRAIRDWQDADAKLEALSMDMHKLHGKVEQIGEKLDSHRRSKVDVSNIGGARGGHPYASTKTGVSDQDSLWSERKSDAQG